LTTTQTYDVENHLTRITHPEGSTSAYQYDGIGKRVQSIEENQVTHFLYDGLNVILERHQVGATQATYTRGLGYGGGIGSIISGLVPQEPDDEDRALVFYHYDGLGAVTDLTDEEGEPTQRYTYEAFGTLLAVEADEPVNPYRW
jgi:YD repeat-containing protein